LRALFFFSSRKDAKPQRNCGPLGMTFRRGGLALRLGGFARLIIFLAKTHRGGQDAKTQRGRIPFGQFDKFSLIKYRNARYSNPGYDNYETY
jgi:hypothetical protein